MHTSDAMPYEPSTPCAQCGRVVDPVRAPCVLMLEHGLRVFCSATCRDGYRSAEPSHRLRAARLQPTETRRDEPAQVVRTETTTTTSLPLGLAPAQAYAQLSPLYLVAPAAGTGLAFAEYAAALPAAAALIGLGTIAVAAAATSARRELGDAAFAAMPIGSALLAAGGALSGSAFDVVAGALCCGLLWLREALTRQEEQRIGAILDALAREVPERTRVSRASVDATEELPLARPSLTAQVRAGDLVLVESGQIVPVDGVVAEGEGQLLAHPGASATRRRSVGDAVLAGARVVEGSVRIAATRVGAARALFRPRSLGSDTSPSAARVSRVVGRLTRPAFAASYALGAALVALYFGSSGAAALSAFAATIASFPALTLVRSVRVPFVAASAKAARRGIVFRDAGSLERAGRVATTVLCSEGSTTLGKPVLIELTPIGTVQDARELLGLALGAELAAPNHPLSQALQEYTRDRGVGPVTVRRAAYAQSRGVTGLVDGAGALALGNRQLLLSTGVSVAVADREAQRAETQGRTVLFLSVGGRVRALLVFEDPTRPEARSAVQSLFDLDIDVVLLSGDHRASVEAIARSLDITHVKAELGTQERGAEVLRLRDAGGLVAVLGRAGSDDATLAAADVSITLDAAGGPREGDLAVASDDLRDVVEGLRIAHRARRTVQNVLAITSAATVVISVSTALSVLPPLGAVVAALMLDAWALPSTARLVPQRRRSGAAGRSSHGGTIPRKEA